MSLQLVDTFSMVERNWETIIDYWNSNNGRKFPIRPIQCASIIDYTKKGIPAQYAFKAIGQSYNTYNSRYQDLLEEVELLASKTKLSEEESDRKSAILNNPLFILMSDIGRAEGLAAIEDFTLFNDKCQTQSDLLPFKMKARYKEIFGEKKDDSSVVNINIKVGGDFIDSI